MSSTFVAIVYNDVLGVSKLFDSLIRQTLMPNEIVVVDAGSDDGTLETLNRYQSKFKKINFQIYLKPGNRSIGRNYAIKKAKGDIIAISDAGCILKKDWFEKITQPFENKEIDVVAGFYKPITKNTFEKALSTYTCVMSDKVNDEFLPSSRSIAFKKNAWEKVDGYPEYLDTCEDLVFAKKLKDNGFTFKVVKSAIVYWPQRKNVSEAFRQFFNYAKGDGEALYFRPQTPLLYLRGMVFLLLVLFSTFFAPKFYLIIFILFVTYVSWAIYKNYKYVNDTRAVMWLPLLQIISDLAVTYGTTVGIISKSWVTRKKR